MTPQSAQPIAADTAAPSHDEWRWMASMPVIVSHNGTDGGPPSPGARRLLVLVPDLDFDEVDLARRVWSLADPRGLPVVYLAAAADPHRESSVRRRLATLAAITRDDRIQVNVLCHVRRSWVDAVAEAARPGDLIVHPPERDIALAWNGRRSTLPGSIATHLLPDLHIERPPDRLRRVMQLAFWPVALAIIAACFWLQTRIDLAAEGVARIVLLSLSVVAEGSLLIAWHAATS